MVRRHCDSPAAAGYWTKAIVPTCGCRSAIGFRSPRAPKSATGMEYGLIELGSHVAYERLHRLLNLEYPRVGRCEWCSATGCRTVYAVAMAGRYSLNRADWLELCDRCHIYYDGVHRPLAAPRSERELEAHYARRMETYKRFMESRGADPRQLEEAYRCGLDRWMRSSTVQAVRHAG